MCGIIGFNWEDKKLLKDSMRKILHRGPDDSGTYTDKNVSLGHRRLSILDLSKNGRQPIYNENGDISIVFNGEIYNYKELKADLKNKHNFKSQTDTELIIHLYEEVGNDVVNYLEGMFSFCIYDLKKGIFFLARDKAGIKPLYYYWKNNRFMFCSEIKGLLAFDGMKRKVNLSPLHSYFTFRANTQEETFFESIYKVMPGHFLIYDLKSGKLKIQKYWEYKIKENGLDFQESAMKLRYLLEDSVRSQLMSDVPYGVYLSGGVDSGVIATLMKKYSTKTLRSFSVEFEEDKNSEAADAKFLADKIGSSHHELVINHNAIKYLPNIVYHTDEPLADPTCIPVYLLSKYTKRYSTVILTGEGADELFGGYPQYKFMKLHDRLIKHFPKPLKKLGITAVRISPSSFVNRIFSYAGALGEKGLERASNFIHAKNQAEQYLQQVSIFNQEEQKELYHYKGNLYRKYQYKYFRDSPKSRVISACQRLDFKESMVDDLLMKLDKNSMAFSVEGRVPFLDSRIIELSSCFPDNFKVKGLWKDKYILRRAVEDLISKKTLERKKKHFFVPIDNWFSNELLPLKEQLLSKKYIEKQKIFNYGAVNKIIAGLEKSKLFYSRQLWALLTFQIWHKIYIENEKIKI